MKKLLASLLLFALLFSLCSCKLPKIQIIYDSAEDTDDDKNPTDDSDDDKNPADDSDDDKNPTDDSDDTNKEYISTYDVKLNTYNITGNVGETHTLTAQVLPSNATDSSVTWYSKDPDVADVSEEGVVTLIAYGITDIYAETVDGKKSACRVIVEKKKEYFEKTITFGNYKDYLNVTIRKTSDAFVIHISPKFENYEYDVTFVYDITVTRIYEAGSRPTTKHDIVKCYIGTYTKPLVGHYNDVDYTLTSISGIVSGYIEK